MSPALFGILQLDRGEPLGYGNLAGLAQAWLQDAGGFAALGLIVYLLYALTVPTHKSESEKLRVPIPTLMVVMAALAFLCYAPLAGVLLAEAYTGKTWTTIAGMPFDPPQPPPPPPGTPIKIEPPVWHWQLRPMLLMIGGLFALVGILQPFVVDLFKLRWRRIAALSRLSFKEAIRYRIHWLGLLILPVFLFRNVWMTGVRPVDEFRTLVIVSSWAVLFLILFLADLLVSFSLPADVKNQTIHTVVTKPVERFEIVLGRFFGYTALMTLFLAGLTVVCLILISTATIDERAQEETAKARVPVRGRLEFRSRKADFEGTNVGREFEYRKYIAGHDLSPQRAVWNFASVPSGLAAAAGDRVPVEFTFDIFRMTKGEENRGVNVAMRFVTHNCPQEPPRPDQGGEWQWKDAEKHRQYLQDVRNLQAKGINPESARPGTPAWDAANQLAEQYGFFEIRGKNVYDYEVTAVEVPAGLFKNARSGEPGKETAKDGAERPRPRFTVYVKCESGGQLLGMAEPDLYLLEGNKSFTQNFLKAMIGLWCRLCIVVGLAVACSTYLSGVLALLATAVVFLTGYFTDHLNDVAYNRSIGGGPFESMSRLVRAEMPTAQPSDTAGTKLLQGFDQVWGWVIRRVQNVIPDVESFSWTHFVSEGFNINTEYLVLNVLVMVGYLLPWGILAYYLMKSREIAA
jgi:hypothetical protein